MRLCLHTHHGMRWSQEVLHPVLRRIVPDVNGRWGPEDCGSEPKIPMHQLMERALGSANGAGERHIALPCRLDVARDLGTLGGEPSTL